MAGQPLTLSRHVDGRPARAPQVRMARLAALCRAGCRPGRLGGLVLGEYPFQGDGIQWLPIMGGAGLGAGIAWVVNRCWGGAPPVWMGAVAGVLAAWAR